jgi:hypothetical protein
MHRALSARESPGDSGVPRTVDDERTIVGARRPSSPLASLWSSSLDSMPRRSLELGCRVDQLDTHLAELPRVARTEEQVPEHRVAGLAKARGLHLNSHYRACFWPFRRHPTEQRRRRAKDVTWSPASGRTLGHSPLASAIAHQAALSYQGDLGHAERRRRAIKPALRTKKHSRRHTGRAMRLISTFVSSFGQDQGRAEKRCLRRRWSRATYSMCPFACMAVPGAWFGLEQRRDVRDALPTANMPAQGS